MQPPHTFSVSRFGVSVSLFKAAFLDVTMPADRNENQNTEVSRERRHKKKKKDKKKKKKRDRTYHVGVGNTVKSNDPNDNDNQQSRSSTVAMKRIKVEPSHCSGGDGVKPQAAPSSSSCDNSTSQTDNQISFHPMVESSNLDYGTSTDDNKVTLLLFYQYQEPPWNEAEYQHALNKVEQLATENGLTGRARVAKEGLNCTLTAAAGRNAMLGFCHGLRQWKPHLFSQTEFKLTHHLPEAQAFKEFKVIPVVELVHYGLPGRKAPPISAFHGQHLEPAEYHAKMTQDDTVMIDVRNHYEAQIGRFDPPAATWLDPNMRKSTEFPVWLDSPETQEALRGKQVLMYCTGLVLSPDLVPCFV